MAASYSTEQNGSDAEVFLVVRNAERETSETVVRFTTEEREENDADDVSDKKRHTWASKREYILTTLGYIVGIGNIWRFPYMCMRNGGGAFLIPFFLCLLLIGLPLFFLEAALGQFTGRSPIAAWSFCPLFKGAGIASCIVSTILFWYFNIIMAWAMYYVVASFRKVVPWSLCGQWWNTPRCTDLLSRAFSDTVANSSSSFLNVTMAWTNHTSEARSVDRNSTSPMTVKLVTAAEEFWQHNVLQQSSGLYDTGHLVWHLVVAECVTMVFIFLALIKGIRSTGKVVYVTATLPYLILTALLIRGVTLPGSVDGILFYITPDFSRLLDPQVWIEAALQVFYSLGPGWGGIITMASYNKFNNNCFRDAVVLCLMGEGTSFIGGFAIFSVMGYMAHEMGVAVDHVVSSGPGLVFIVYPQAISLMPLPQLWAVLFFLMIITLVVDSQFQMAETILSALSDHFPSIMGRRRTLVTAVMFAVFLLTSLVLVAQGGIYIFQLVDWFIAAYSIIVVVLAECVCLGWVYGADRFGDDIRLMTGRKPPMVIRLLWCFLSPALLVLLLVVTLARYQPPTYGDYHYDTWAIVIGWAIATFSFVPVPVVALYQLAAAKGSLLQRLRQTTRPDETWGPAETRRRQLYQKDVMHRQPRRSWLDIIRA